MTETDILVTPNIILFFFFFKFPLKNTLSRSEDYIPALL